MLVTLVGCKSEPQYITKNPVPVENFAGAPQWIDNLDAAFPGDQGKVLYAVGSGSDLNPRMARRRAATTARQEMAAIMKSHVQTMIKDWMASSKDYADPDSASSKEFTESISRDVAEATLVGAQVRQTWTSPSGSIYMLMALDMNDSFFKEIKAKTEKALKDQKHAVLKVKMEDALADLDKYLDGKRK